MKRKKKCRFVFIGQARDSMQYAHPEHKTIEINTIECFFLVPIYDLLIVFR